MEKEYLECFKVVLRIIKEYDSYDDFCNCLATRNKNMTTPLKSFLFSNPFIMADKSCIEMFIEFMKFRKIKDTRTSWLYAEIIPCTPQGNFIYHKMLEHKYDYKEAINYRIKYVLENPKYIE